MMCEEEKAGVGGGGGWGTRDFHQRRGAGAKREKTRKRWGIREVLADDRRQHTAAGRQVLEAGETSTVECPTTNKRNGNLERGNKGNLERKKNRGRERGG
eukprot:Hpha_TRINITY_DN15008_c2_g9::TRINITY_DN15008_c2_g9_i2::g.123925::m.123925